MSIIIDNEIIVYGNDVNGSFLEDEMSEQQNQTRDQEDEAIELILNVKKKKYIDEVERARQKRRKKKKRKTKKENKLKKKKKEKIDSSTDTQTNNNNNNNNNNNLTTIQNIENISSLKPINNKKKKKGKKKKKNNLTTPVSNGKNKDVSNGDIITENNHNHHHNNKTIEMSSSTEDDDEDEEEELLLSKTVILPEAENNLGEISSDNSEIENAIIELKKSFSNEKEFIANLNTILLFIRRYPRIRIANPKLTPEGVNLLQVVGFIEERGYLLITDFNRAFIKKNEIILNEQLARLTGDVSGIKRSFPVSDVVCIPSTRFPAAYADTKGRREEMEDKVVILGGLGKQSNTEDYFAVFDGHGGVDAAAFASCYLHQFLLEQMALTSDPVQSLITSFQQITKQIETAEIDGGTTALVAYCLNDKVYIANAGDSRAVIYSRHNKIIRVTTDHKPNNPTERKRIKESGGRVTHAWWFSKCYRVNGVLAVSRALGDTGLHPFIISEPDVFEISDFIGDNSIMIMACDGLWDVCSDSRAIKIALKYEDPAEASQMLRNYAFRKGSTDNISVLVIQFPKKKKKSF